MQSGNLFQSRAEFGPALGQVVWIRYCGSGGVGQVVWVRYCGSGGVDQVLWVRWCGSGTVGQVLWIRYCGSGSVGQVVWVRYCGSCGVGQVVWIRYYGSGSVGQVLWVSYCGDLQFLTGSDPYVSVQHSDFNDAVVLLGSLVTCQDLGWSLFCNEDGTLMVLFRLQLNLITGRNYRKLQREQVLIRFHLKRSDTP